MDHAFVYCIFVGPACPKGDCSGDFEHQSPYTLLYNKKQHFCFRCATLQKNPCAKMQKRKTVNKTLYVKNCQKSTNGIKHRKKANKSRQSTRAEPTGPACPHTPSVCFLHTPSETSHGHPVGAHAVRGKVRNPFTRFRSLERAFQRPFKQTF